MSRWCSNQLSYAPANPRLYQRRRDAVQPCGDSRRPLGYPAPHRARRRASFETPVHVATESPFKSRGGVARILAATRYSMDGLRAAWTGEAAFRQELALCAVLVPIALWLPVPRLESLALIGTLALLLIVELLNSAIEAVVDRVGVESHPLSKRAKDIGSAAVFVALALVCTTWGIVLWPFAVRALG
jgi:diacylglycerol kinase (ATP)